MKKVYTPLKSQLGKLGFLLACLAGTLPNSSYSQALTYSFTTAGATGTAGPTQAQVTAAYTSGNLSGSVTSNNGIQSFTIPATAPYRIIAIGAQGGYGGGTGAYVSGDYTLTAGTVLNIIVGQQGVTATNNSNTSGGGGGGSFILDASNSPYVIAGGGGGNGSGYNNTGNVTPCCQNGMEASLTTSGNGNAPSTTGGTPGTNGGSGGNGGQCASGTTAYSGAGAFGDGTICNNTFGSTVDGTAALSFTNGGTGGQGGCYSGDIPAGDGGFGGGGGGFNSGSGERGGGGGGYSGGGGGIANTGYDAAGGGGGSYNSGANQTASLTTNTGDGMVMLVLLCDVNLTASTSNSTVPHICSGQTVTLSTNAISGYNWSTGATTQTIAVSPTVTTTYTVSGNSALSCSNTAAITITVSNAVPTLTLSANSTSVCQGNSVTLSGAGALTYTWSTNATSTSSNTSITVSPASNTTYTLTGANGCGTTNTTIAITVSPLPVTAATNASLVCASSPATLTSTGATTYTWNPGAATNNTFVVTPSANTIYTVTGQSGNCMTSATVAVNTNPLPTLSIGTTTTNICQGDQITLNVTGNANSYTWTPGNQTGASITDSPAMTTVYSVEGTNSFGCTNSTTQLILVTLQPNIHITSSNSVVCSGSPSTLTATGAHTYSWFSGATTSVVVVSPTVSGSYSVTGTSTAGCTATLDISITALTPTVGVTSDAVAVCIGSHANLTASGADTYTWSNTSNAPSISVSPTVNTTYTVMGSVTDLNSGLSCDASNTIAISINPNPTITATASRNTICIGESVLVTAAGGNTYTWTGGAGVVTTATNMVNPIADQSFTVTGVDANGCKGKGVVLVQVSECTGIATIKGNNNSLSIYPNPSNGEFTISSDQSITLHISNELGQEVKTISLTDSNREVKVNNLSNGIYFITGKNENGNVMQKIIIAK